VFEKVFDRLIIALPATGLSAAGTIATALGLITPVQGAIFQEVIDGHPECASGAARPFDSCGCSISAT
jgi:hypothetical protein